jgi:hypothetical protein
LNVRRQLDAKLNGRVDAAFFSRMFSFLSHLSTRDSTVGNELRGRQDGCCSHAPFLFLLFFLSLIFFVLSFCFSSLFFKPFLFLLPPPRIEEWPTMNKALLLSCQYRRGYTRPLLITAKADDQLPDLLGKLEGAFVPVPQWRYLVGRIEATASLPDDD